VPRHIGQRSRKFDTASSVLRKQSLRLVSEEIRVEQFVIVLSGFARGRLRTPEVDPVPVSHDDGIDRRILPGDTIEAERLAVVDKGCRQISCKELGCDLRIMPRNIPCSRQRMTWPNCNDAEATRPM
jgi:hypothetical protein